jgi:hypothetical protein
MSGHEIHNLLQAVFLVLTLGSIVALFFRRVRDNKALRRTAVGIVVGIFAVFLTVVLAFGISTSNASTHRCMTPQECSSNN